MALMGIGLLVCLSLGLVYTSVKDDSWCCSTGIHRRERDIKKQNEEYYGPKPPVNGRRSWEIVREVLDRVFGNGEKIKREGWISHITQFIQMLGNALTGGGLGTTGTEDGSQSGTVIPSTPPEVETFNPLDVNFVTENNIQKNKSEKKSAG